jgi:hypothetical protein
VDLFDRRYTKMLGAANFSKVAFQGAYDAYNRRAVDFFRDRGEPCDNMRIATAFLDGETALWHGETLRHRLLVVDLTVRGQERAASQALCEFVEAWGSCESL